MNKCTTKNPVNTTLGVIGGKWKPLILWFVTRKTMRFNELAREITGITQKMLTQQLRDLEKEGLILRKVYAEIPPRVEYTISDYGRTLEPVLSAMAAWGKAHEARNQPTAILLHEPIYDVLTK